MLRIFLTFRFGRGQLPALIDDRNALDKFAEALSEYLIIEELPSPEGENTLAVSIAPTLP